MSKIIARGYGVITAYYSEIVPDHVGGLAEGVTEYFQNPPGSERKDDEWGAVGAWAWALSRILDYCEQDNSIDASKIALNGHSRLGKTALWAGAQDPRFAIVISNDSGMYRGSHCAPKIRRIGGTNYAKLSRVVRPELSQICRTGNRITDRPTYVD